MSGFIGIYYLDQRSVQSNDLNRMLDAIAQRGSDGSKSWHLGSVGFGHRMLWSTPESLFETLPLTKDSLTITADARIDNRDELLSALDLNQRLAEEIADSELILAAYKQWGEQCPKKLLGDFAFAIWDAQKEKLFCARDHMGVKPFCYHYQPERLFVFASDIKALLSLKEIPHRLNEKKVGDYLAALFTDKSSTFFENIFYLPPASHATINADEMHVETYWCLDSKKELRLGSDEEYALALEKIFVEAVRCRLRSAFPIGTHLSGGLDSSSVTCVARKILPEDCSLHTFSNIFETTTECDERPFIDAVLEQGNFIPHFVAGDVRGPLSDLDFVKDHHSGIVGAPNHFLLLGIGETARQAGVRVILDGCDGDTTVSHGLEYLSELAHKGDWAGFASETKGLKEVMNYSPSHVLYAYGLDRLEALARFGKWLAFVRQGQQLRQHFNISWRRLILRHGLKPLVPDIAKRVWHRMRGNRSDDNVTTGIIIADFAKRTRIRERSRAEALTFSQRPKTQREGHYLDLNAGVLTHAIEIIQDYSSAFQIETRSPFMDKRLIEFCLALPPEQKLRKGWTRYVMRQAMKTTLPDKIWKRADKANMGSSVFYGLLHHDKHRLKLIMQRTLPLAGHYVDIDVMQQLYAGLSAREDQENAADHANLTMFYRGVMLAIWLENWLGKQSFAHLYKAKIFDKEYRKKEST